MARSPRRVLEDSVVLVDGPWTHRGISANGIRFHAVEAGAGPLVLLLHGFPEFWWAWRHQIIALAEAGFRVVAPDLRGYGASDKPPRGYDATTLSGDVAGMIRALGERDAVVVGQDWGGVLGWTTAALHPAVVRRLVVISTPHPLRMRTALLTDVREHVAASRYMLGFQTPWKPERWLVEDDAVNVARMLHAWSAPGFPDEETQRRCRDAMQILYVPHSALEYYRWWVRSQLRPDGHRFAKRLRESPIRVPTLQLHGTLDTCILPSAAQGSGRYVSGPYEWRLIDDVAHFPHEEAPDLVSGELVRWCKGG